MIRLRLKLDLFYVSKTQEKRMSVTDAIKLSFAILLPPFDALLEVGLERAFLAEHFVNVTWRYSRYYSCGLRHH